MEKTSNVDDWDVNKADDVLIYPVSDSDVPSNVKLASAFAELSVPSDVKTLLSW